MSLVTGYLSLVKACMLNGAAEHDPQVTVTKDK
jgi:hypothetical protein